MRILGFSRMWPKLEQSRFTTFRLPRRDRDWGVDYHCPNNVEELVQVVFKPRSKERMKLGVAKIVDKGHRDIRTVTEAEAQEDGFNSHAEMMKFMMNNHDIRRLVDGMNKLTLEWIVRGDSKEKGGDKPCL